MILMFECEKHNRRYHTDYEPENFPICDVCFNKMERKDVSPKLIQIEEKEKNERKKKGRNSS
jgi:hypothetical protein